MGFNYSRRDPDIRMKRAIQRFQGPPEGQDPEEWNASMIAQMYSDMAAETSAKHSKEILERQARAALEEPSRTRMMRMYMMPGQSEGIRNAIDPFTWRPKDETIKNKGNYWSDMIVAAWKGNPGPNIMDYIPRTAVQDTPNMSFSPMAEESKDAAGNTIETSSIQFDPRQRRVPYAEYERRKQAAAGPEPNPYSVVRGVDVNTMMGSQPAQAEASMPQAEGGDEQALQEILSQEEYNPDSGMTYQEWLEWKLANQRSLGALGKITGARMPNTGQRR